MRTWLTTARLTGLFYLGLAITGALAFLFARAELYVDGDAVATTANMVDRESLARFGIAAEVALVGFAALAAMWFYKLFRKVNSFAAITLAAFGLVNAVAILVSSAFWLGALETALAGGQAATVLTLFDVHNNIWVVTNLFFGLWLLPMGYLVIKAKMPRPLAWFLIAGGIGYILATFVTVILPEQSSLAEVLPLPATVGEFWIIGYLLFKRVQA